LTPLALSVVIPTRNRVGSLARTLRAIVGQGLPPSCFETIVVADGCTGGTREFMERFASPLRLRCIEQRRSGAAAARNHGAVHSAGRLIAFVDDDIEPTAGWLRAHLEAHERRPGGLVLGPSATAPASVAGNFYIATRNAWSDFFSRLAEPGHRWRFSDFAAGNFSIEAAAFRSIGGFDESFPACAREDFELGARLIARGIAFQYAADAGGVHHELEGKDLASKLERAKLEGRGDVLIGRRHPSLRTVLPLGALAHRRSGLGAGLRDLAFRKRWLGDRLAALLRETLFVLERLHMERRWEVGFFNLREYAYFCGVAEELGSEASLRAFLEEGARTARRAQPSLGTPIDLADGLAAAERRLDELRPAGISLVHRGSLVGTLPPEPGAEPLAGRHLRGILATMVLDERSRVVNDLRFLVLRLLRDVARERSQDRAIVLQGAQP
jgi:glycosyltransferase involved in cell wall biosynthesis